ncbi:MAG: hypothetical protein JWM68_4119 [Verrucomicrobiales bacterium]|nr:hypothetical protein [Verrucomicrobiales bacterium]
MANSIARVKPSNNNFQKLPERMKQNSKLRHQEEQQATQQQHSEQKTDAKEFSSVDEMLRHDASQTAVPPNVADKLNRSIASEPQPASWLKRLVNNLKVK